MVRFAARWWAPFVIMTAAAIGILSMGPAHDATWAHSTLAFAVVVMLASACALGAAAVLATGLMRSLAEVARLGSALWTVSVLSLVHGLLLPGNAYGPNTRYDRRRRTPSRASTSSVSVSWRCVRASASGLTPSRCERSGSAACYTMSASWSRRSRS